MSLTIIGYMGSGKTNHCKRLGNRLELPTFDLDDEIEKYTSSTVTEIFSKLGETGFREIESHVLKRMLKDAQIVLSLGGGTPCMPNNLAYILQNSFSVYFKMDAKMAYKRLKDNKGDRPIIADKEGEVLASFIENQITEREQFYSQSNMTVNAGKITAAVLDDIRDQYLNWLNGRQLNLFS